MIIMMMMMMMIIMMMMMMSARKIAKRRYFPLQSRWQVGESMKDRQTDTERKKNMKKKAVYTTACGWEGVVIRFGCLFGKNFNSELTDSHTGDSKPTDRQTDRQTQKERKI